MNADHIVRAYFGDPAHPSTQRCRRRIHWMCEQAIGRQVLDIGCSEGIVALILAREGFSCTGVDLEDAALQYARQERDRESELVRARLHFQTADATALPFDDHSFDTVMVGEVLEHLTHPERVLMEARRVLTADGRLVITVPLGLTHEHADHKRIFYPSSLVRLARPYFETVSVSMRDTYVLYTGARRSRDIAAGAPSDGDSLLRQLEEHCLTMEAERSRARMFLRNFKQELKDARRRLAALDALETRMHDAEAAVSAQQAALARAEETARRLQVSVRDKERQHVAAMRELEATLKKKLAERERSLKTLTEQAARRKQTDQISDRLRQFAASACPRGASILVISKGDDQLITLQGQTGLHFPQDEHGLYAGFHPLDSAWAIAHVEELKCKGAGYLLLPAAAFWWLTHYVEFREYLASSGTPLAYDPDVALVLRLTAPLPGECALPEDTIALAAAAFGAESTPASAIGAGTQPGALPSPAADTKAVRTSPAPPAGAPANQAPKVAPPLPSLVSASAVSEPPRRNGVDPVTVAAVLDRFTASCLRPEARLVTFRPDNWKATLEQHRPDVLFVESAWQGNDGAWKYRIANYATNMGDELLDLVQWARRHDIPTVFWNKEDPVHFDRFLGRSAAFDFVFTTDASCVPKYRAHFGHDRVYDLPFAAQPVLHNPVQTESRSGSVCFAGTYYGSRHDERRRDLTHVLQPALQYGLDIYDRQSGLGSSDTDSYSFPDVFQPAIRGRLEYDEMVQAYKRYRVFLNVNSVKDSPTMFSRRVFELLACGTPVVSSYARGMVELLGDAVFISESEHDTRRHLDNLLNDADTWARASVRGMRRVLGAHTYRKRLASVWDRIGLGNGGDRDTSITVLAQLRSREGGRRLAEALRAQTLRPREVVLVADGIARQGTVEWWRSHLAGIPVHQVTTPADAWKQAVEPSDADCIAVMDDRDHYSADYLRDYGLAAEYSTADFFGKQTFQRRDGHTRLSRVTPGSEFRAARVVPTATLVVRRQALSADLLQAALASRAFSRPGDEILSIDWFNYIQDAHVAHGTAAPLDTRLLAQVEA